MVNFWHASGSRHVSHLIRNSKKQTTGYAKQNFFLRTSPNCFRGHSTFRGINGPEDTHPSEESTASWTLLLLRALPFQDQSFRSRARQPQQQISLISAYIHRVRYVARSSHVSNVATTPTSAQDVTEGSRNHCRNQEHYPGRYEKIVMCRSCGYWNLHDPHC